MEWTNVMIIEFLELYEKEECIWNPTDPLNKDRLEIQHAWERIRDGMSVDCTVHHLKRKRESLMATFRLHMNKRKSALMSGETKYKPGWFAYPYMERFLSQFYVQQVDTEYQDCDESIQLEEEEEDVKEKVKMFQDFNHQRRRVADNDNETITNIRNTSFETERVTPKRSTHDTDPLSEKQPSSAATTKSKDPSELMAVIMRKRQMNEAFGCLKSISQTARMEKDDYDLYGELMARKLRKLDENVRDSVMNEIDNMLYQAKKRSDAQNVISLNNTTDNQNNNLNSNDYVVQSITVDNQIGL